LAVSQKVITFAPQISKADIAQLVERLIRNE
jgi:hypothetical protein